MVAGLKGSTYDQKLTEVGLTTLVERRLREDLIVLWKILHGHDDVFYNNWFTFASTDAQQTTRLTSGEFNLRQQRFKTETRRHFFSQRVVEKWNALPETIKCAKSLNAFKNTYDRWRKTI